MLRENIEIAARRGLELLAVSDPLRLSEWMGRHFYFSPESSQEERPWTAWPFQIAIMNCISNDEVEEFIWVKPTRVGYTKIITGAMGYFSQHKRRNQAMWQPTDNDAVEFSKTEFDSMMRDVPIMETVFPAFMQRHKDNTLNLKKLLGSMIYIRGGKAAKNFRRITVSVTYIDELDEFDINVEKQGSPPKLSDKRLQGATFPKKIRGSTPMLKEYSMIEALAKKAKEYFRWHTPCPDCGVEHVVDWGEDNNENKLPDKGFVWTDNNPETAAHICPDCGVFYTQSEYLKVWHKGRWISKNDMWMTNDGEFKTKDGKPVPAPRSVAVHNWTAHGEMVSWADNVKEYIEAEEALKAGDDSLMIVFRNCTLAKSYEVQVEKADEHELMQRADDYRLRAVPWGGLMLCAGVDTQDDRFEVAVWAFGRGEEMWIVDYVVIPANPAVQDDWDNLLYPYLKTVFPHQSGASLPISAVAVDTAGHFTHEAYNFCRKYRKKRIYAIHGSKSTKTPIKGRSSNQDVNFKGKILKRGIKLWNVGVHNAKNLLFGRLKVKEPGPGYIHFSSDLALDFYMQLTAEHRIPIKTSRGQEDRWVLLAGRRNEVLDCTVYAIFAAHMRGVNIYREGMWKKLEETVQPVNGILFGSDGQPLPGDLASPPKGKTYHLKPDQTIDDVKDQEPAASAAEDPVDEVQEQEEQKPKRKSRRRKRGFVHNY